jgi:hypothetical protein
VDSREAVIKAARTEAVQTEVAREVATRTTEAAEVEWVVHRTTRDPPANRHTAVSP